MLISKDQKWIQDLAQCVALPSTQKDILKVTGPALDLAYQKLIGEHQDLLVKYKWKPLMDTMPIHKLPALKFEIIHSPLPYILKSLARYEKMDEGENESTRMAHLRERGHDLLDSLDRVIRRMGAREPHYQIYQIQSDKARVDLFPSPGRDIPVPYRKDSEFREEIDKARSWVHKWKPTMMQEIDLFIRDYALSRSLDNSYTTESVEYDPGHVKIFPRLVLKEAGMLDYEGTDTEAILLAAELIRESRRQKIFYFNRILDLDSKSQPNAFVHERAKKEILKRPFEKETLATLFEKFLALGFEVMFLEFLIKSDPLDEYPSALEIRLEDKRQKFLTIASFVVKNKTQLTDLGIASIKKLI